MALIYSSFVIILFSKGDRGRYHGQSDLVVSSVHINIFYCPLKKFSVRPWQAVLFIIVMNAMGLWKIGVGL